MTITPLGHERYAVFIPAHEAARVAPVLDAADPDPSSTRVMRTDATGTTWEVLPWCIPNIVFFANRQEVPA